MRKKPRKRLGSSSKLIGIRHLSSLNIAKTPGAGQLTLQSRISVDMNRCFLWMIANVLTTYCEHAKIKALVSTWHQRMRICRHMPLFSASILLQTCPCIREPDLSTNLSCSGPSSLHHILPLQMSYIAPGLVGRLRQCSISSRNPG